MFKALLRKQMMEVGRIYFRKRKRGSSGTEGSRSPGLVILFIFVYIIMLAGVYAISALVGTELIRNGLAWVYFMIMTVLAFVVGIFGSVMTTYTELFRAKDNEFLLAMPIPPSKILISRMLSSYIVGVIYESMVLLSAIVYYYVAGRPSALSVVLCAAGFFVLGFLILVFSCFFGWVVALVSSRLNNQKVLSAIMIAIVTALFIYLRFEANRLFEYLATHGEEIADAVSGWGYPIYALGLGMSGDLTAFVIFTAVCGILFALTCFIMSRSFNKIVTARNSSVRAEFSEQQIRTRSISSSLRKKEFRHFTSSVAYMVNCALGALFLVAAAAILLIKVQDVRSSLESIISEVPSVSAFFPVIGTFAVCALASLCDIAAPAISLEGKNIWILQTMPVDPYEIFKAKIFLHISIALIPSLLCTASVIIVFKAGFFSSVCMILCVCAFVVLSSGAMLALDLKRPMLDWTNETQPIKQSLNILISWLGGLFVSIVLGVIYIPIGFFVDPAVYLFFCFALFSLFIFMIRKWLRNKGRQLFAAL